MRVGFHSCRRQQLQSVLTRGDETGGQHTHARGSWGTPSFWWCPNAPAGTLDRRTWSPISTLGLGYISDKTWDQDSHNAFSRVFAQLRYQDHSGLTAPALKKAWHLGQPWKLFQIPEAELVTGQWSAAMMHW